jgi:hypothetical protein
VRNLRIVRLSIFNKLLKAQDLRNGVFVRVLPEEPFLFDGSANLHGIVILPLCPLYLERLLSRRLTGAWLFFLVFIRYLREPLTPEMLSRLQALSPDLLLRRLVASRDPNNLELSLSMAVLNNKFVPNLDLASITTQPHTVVGDIEGMREMAVFTAGDPEAHRHDRFGSFRTPLSWLA